MRRGLEVLTGDVGRGDAAELWRETGRRRARQGVPLELVLHAYTVGTRLMWEALVDRGAGAGIGDRVLLAAASTVWANLDTQNAVLVDAYRRESSRLQRQDLQRQQAALDALLEGRGADPVVAEEARATLDLGSDDDLACLVVLHEGAGDVADAMTAVEDRLERGGIVSRWHLRPGVSVGLLAGDLPEERDLADLVAPSVPARAGVARAHGGLAGFATAYLLATRTAETLRPRRAAGGVGDRAAAGGAARRQPAGDAAPGRAGPRRGARPPGAAARRCCSRRSRPCCATTARRPTRPRTSTATATR